MRARQPRVQRHQPRLGPEPDDRRDRDDGRHTGRQCHAAADRPVIGERQQRHPRAHSADVRDREIHEHCPAHTRVGSPGGQDRRRRQQRHQLPARKQRRHIPGEQEQHQREQERRRQRRDRPPPGCLREVPDGIHERRHRDHRQRRQKDPAQPIDPQRRMQLAAERAARGRGIGGDHDAHDAEDRHPQRLGGQRRTATTTPHRRQPAEPDAASAQSERDLSGEHPPRRRYCENDPPCNAPYELRILATSKHLEPWERLEGPDWRTARALR